jgi:hypothetical protein
VGSLAKEAAPKSNINHLVHKARKTGARLKPTPKRRALQVSPARQRCRSLLYKTQSRIDTGNWVTLLQHGTRHIGRRCDRPLVA